MKVGDRVRVLVDVPTLWTDLPKIPAGVEGAIVKVFPADDSAFHAQLLIGGEVKLVTFFENEVGQLVEVLACDTSTT